MHAREREREREWGCERGKGVSEKALPRANHLFAFSPPWEGLPPAARLCSGVSCWPGWAGIPPLDPEAVELWPRAWGSVAEDGAGQLVGQRVPALDFLVLVFQAVEPVLQPLPFGINS